MLSSANSALFLIEQCGFILDRLDGPTLLEVTAKISEVTATSAVGAVERPMSLSKKDWNEILKRLGIKVKDVSE